MWKDISRSVFVFGMGTFVILSSSYTKDLNIRSGKLSIKEINQHLELCISLEA